MEAEIKRTDRLITAEELSEMLGCSERTLARHVAANVAPPSFRVGGKRYWRESDYQAWLDK